MPRVRRNEFPDFSGQADALRRTFRAMPRVVGNIAVNFYKDRFRRGGWQGDRYEPWKPRARNDRRNASRRAILVKTGRLRRSIRIVRTTDSSVTVGTSVPYAKIHNEGGTIRATQNVPAHQRRAHTRRQRGQRVNVKAHTVKAHSRQLRTTIPKRKFIGASPFLTKRIVMQINKGLARTLRNR